MSFKAEVIADSSGKWVSNGLAFATKKEAEMYVDDLAMRWMSVSKTRVVESTEAVNYRMVEVEPHLWKLESTEKEVSDGGS